jgi:hypothetical protein
MNKKIDLNCSHLNFRLKSSVYLPENRLLSSDTAAIHNAMRIIFLMFLVVCCNSNFNFIFGNEINESDEIFSSPITVPLYTNTIVETNINDNLNNTNNQSNTENKKNHNSNTNKLRPRYNITPNLGNRIELVAAQTANSLPEPPPITHADFNSLKPKANSKNTTFNHTQSDSTQSDSTSFASTQYDSISFTSTSSDPTASDSVSSASIDLPIVTGNLPYNLTGQVHSPDLSVAQNKFATNNINEHDEIQPFDIPDTPDCHSNSSHDKFIGNCCGTFFGINNQHTINQHNNISNLFCEGWVESGIFFNANPPNEKRNPIIQYNDRDREFIINQLYISFGRKLTYRRNMFELGGQIDLLFGTDYFYTSALGLETRRSMYITGGNTIYPEEAAAHWNASHGKRRNNTAALYGLSLPQAFGEIRLPFTWDTTIKAGHFYANTGIESAAATQNFFYSHSYNFMFGQPTTLTGTLITTELPTTYYNLRNRQTLIFGITQGWDMFDKQGGLNYIFGTQTISKRNDQNYVSLIAQIGRQSKSNPNDCISYTLTINRKLTNRLTDSLEHTLGYEKDGAVEILPSGDEKYSRSCWISVAKYLTYEINTNLSIGLRAEWFRDDGIARILKAPINANIFYYTGKNYYEITLGANWKPTRNITIRPELRFDWSDVKLYSHFPIIAVKPGNYNGKTNMTSFAVDAIIRF